MSFRKAIFWLHLIAGVVAGIIILVMSVTGLFLAYERQITSWADGYKLSPAANEERVSMETLLSTVRATQSNAVPSSVVLRADPTAPVAFGFGKEKTVFANPYTGEVFGQGAVSTRAFFHWAVALHRWLGAEGEKREVGKAITGAANLVFLFLVISGVYLWFPRKWTAGSLRSITMFKGGLRGKARDWNWHNVIGFWSALPLVFIVSSAVVISYPWASDLLYRLTGNEPPPPRSATPAAGRAGGAGAEGGRKSAGKAELNWSQFNQMWETARGQVEGWQMITLRPPTSTDAPFAFTVDLGNGTRPDLRTTINMDSATGAIVNTETYSSQNLGRRLRSWVRWVHTGEAGGLFGQTFAAIATAGAVILVFTGLMLTWRRFLGRKSAQDVQTAEVSREMANR